MGMEIINRLINFKFIMNFFIRDGKDIMKLQEQLSQVYADLESIDSDKAPSRAAKILCGLGFSPDDQKKKTK